MRNAKRNAQSGFTFIELLIVTAIIGIISMIVLPEVRTYNARAKVSEAILLLSNCRNSIHEGYLSSQNLPAADGWGCEGSGRRASWSASRPAIEAS